MTSQGYSYAQFADMYLQISLKNSRYLAFRDIPDLLQKYTHGNKALDFGCGYGKSTEFLEKHGFMVDSVDINEHMIDLARKALPHGNFQVIKKNKLPAKNEHYDLVFASWVLHHIGSKDELTASFSEIVRVLKKDGIFVTIILSEEFFGRDWSDVTSEFEENKNLKSGDEAKIIFKENNVTVRSYFWSENDFQSVLREVGFHTILVHKPLGRDDEGFPWKNETIVAPYIVYVAKKK